MAEHGFDEGNWVQDLSWTAVEQRLAAGAVALLPIGAASKEHGPHLPHGTDYIQAAYYAERLAETFDFLIWPVATYGYYPVFTEYPGSISLREETFRAIVAEILDGIAVGLLEVFAGDVAAVSGEQGIRHQAQGVVRRQWVLIVHVNSDSSDALVLQGVEQGRLLDDRPA